MHAASFVAGGYAFSIVASCKATETALAVEARNLACARHLPQSQCLVMGGGDDVPAVGGDGDSHHPVSVALETARLPVRHLPKSYAMVRGAGDNVPAVGRERDHVYCVSMTLEGAGLPACS